MAKQFTLLAAFLIVLAIGAGAEESVLSGEGDTVPSAASAGPGTSAASAGSSATEHSGATKDPDGPSTATVLPPTEVPATTQPPNPCDSNPCGSGSTCEARANQTFVCLCLPGDFYVILTQSCLKAQVFPGTLALTTMDYDEKMADKTTKEFQETSKIITDEINEIFIDKNSLGSTVVALRKFQSSKVSSKSSDKVEASVEIIFQANAGVKEATVKETFEKAKETPGSLFQGSTFIAKNLCDSDPCEKITTHCTSEDGSFTCSCSKGYFPTGYSDRMCVACPSGEREEDSKCVPCSFGYSGLNCDDDRLLMVVIAASVLGGLLLIALIILPIVAVQTKKKGSKKSPNEDLGKPYISHSIAKSPAVNGNVQNGHSSSFNKPASAVAANPGIPRIPRATGGWDNKTNLEMAPSSSRQNLISSGRNTWINDDQDDAFTFSQSRPQNNHYEDIRPQNNHYEDIRPQNNRYEDIRPQQNPYAQKPAVNPYAQRQGASNPYYTPDDDRWSR